jgi:cephalosporin hydroxylase
MKSELCMSNPNKADALMLFKTECDSRVSEYPRDANWYKNSSDWIEYAFRHKYMYNFSFLGRPIIQTPIDMVAMQELIWQVKPDLIIETGIAYGGSLIMSASMMSLIDYCEAVEAGEKLDPKASHRRVLGIDIDIRLHNLNAIREHPMSHKIEMIQGSSVDSEVIAQVYKYAENYSRVLVCLDSNHTHDHVLAELEAYAPLTGKGSYCCVFDTIVEDLPDNIFSNRPWGKGNNPKTAVREFLKTHNEFEIDKAFENKLMITVAPEGYLKKIEE